MFSEYLSELGISYVVSELPFLSLEIMFQVLETLCHNYTQRGGIMSIHGYVSFRAMQVF